MTNRVTTIDSKDLETATGGATPYRLPTKPDGQIWWSKVNWNKLLTGPFFTK